MELEELKKQVDDAVKRQRDYSLAFTVLDAQLRNMKTLLAEGEQMRNVLETRNKDIEKVFNAQFAERVEALRDKEIAVVRREEKVQDSETEFRKRENDFNYERMRCIALQDEAKTAKDAYAYKTERILQLMAEFKEAISIL